MNSKKNSNKLEENDFVSHYLERTTSVLSRRLVGIILLRG